MPGESSAHRCAFRPAMPLPRPLFKALLSLFTFFAALAAPALPALSGWGPPAAHARPSDDRLATRTFRSAALGGTQRYRVWLPPGYREGATRYPAVVLLHGLGGEGANWFDPQLGDLHATLERLVANGTIAPFVAIAPDGKNGYWTDHLGKPRERYGAFIDEVVADAEAHYRLSPVRAIVGASMGGHGAMSAALMAPGRYRAVVSLAGALFGEPPTHRKIYKEVWGDPADPEHWRKTAPMALVRSLSAASAPAIFLHCGKADVDRFLDWTLAAAKLLDELHIAHELVLSEGAHGWTTWRGVNERWLRWLDEQLSR